MNDEKFKLNKNYNIFMFEIDRQIVVVFSCVWIIKFNQ